MKKLELRGRLASLTRHVKAGGAMPDRPFKLGATQQASQGAKEDLLRF